MTVMVGYVVRATDAAIAFVSEEDSHIVGIKPLWIPRKKIVHSNESDSWSRNIVTAQDGERVGTPIALDIDDAFLAKIGIAA